MAPFARWFRRILIAFAAGILLLGAYLLFPWPMPAATAFALIAHHGVHQTFPLAGLTNETCTAAMIDSPPHQFIENTLPSMRAAFAAGATAVELDIHRSAGGQLAVFHDWTLDCRTDGTGVTNRQTLAALQRLDLGYGYTADGGTTFPLRGTGVGLPALPGVLAAFPDEQFVLDDKDGDGATAAPLADYLATLPPDERAWLSYWGGDTSYALLRSVRQRCSATSPGGARCAPASATISSGCSSPANSPSSAGSRSSAFPSLCSPPSRAGQT